MSTQEYADLLDTDDDPPTRMWTQDLEDAEEIGR